MIYVSDKCIPNEAESNCGRWRCTADRVILTGIDRHLFVFAIGLDSINSACVMITVPPCQQVTERESVRERGRGGVLLVVGTMRRRRRRVGPFKWAFSPF